MKLPRRLLLPLWIVLVLTAYYLVVFTNVAYVYHGGSRIGTVVVDAAVVLAAFSSWEVFRTERLVQVRAVAVAVGVPLVLVALLTLWLGVLRHVAS